MPIRCPPRAALLALCRFLVAIVVGVTMAGVARAAPPVQKAVEHYDRGTQFYAERRFEEARAEYAAAYEIQARPEYLRALAHAELRTGAAASAATHFARYLRESEGAGEADRQEAEIDFAAARAQVAEATVETAEGAELWLDGEKVGTAPLDHSLFLSPGLRVVEARSEGRVTRESVTANPGDVIRVRLAFPSGAPPSLAPPPAETEDASATEAEVVPAQDGRQAFFPWLGEHPPAWLLAGLTIVGVGAGTGFAIAAKSQFDYANDVRDQILARAAAQGRSVPCEDPGVEYAAACREFVDTRDTGNVERTVAIVGFATGGASLAALLLYYFIDSPEQGGDAAAFVVSPHVGSSATFLQLQGRF